jgi:hypothetical protein|tara:strand:- start:728 stop:958 length:231 start_codon:yes stop_codon:yes gene_type:complete
MSNYKEEILTFTVNKKKVKVFHRFDVESSGKYLKDQNNGLNELKSLIKDDMVFKNELDGYYPYNNFTSYISWKLIN